MSLTKHLRNPIEKGFKNRLRKCGKGKHSLRVILRVACQGNIDEVIRWCKVCGAVVVDHESDRRLVSPGGGMDMTWPEIAGAEVKGK